MPPPTSFRGSARSALFLHALGGRSSSGPAWPAARPETPLSIGSALPSPLLVPRELPLLAQSYLEEHQEDNCAKTEGDQRDPDRFAGQPLELDGTDRTSDNERRGRSKCQDARAGRHRPKVSLGWAAGQITVAGRRLREADGPCLFAPGNRAHPRAARYVGPLTLARSATLEFIAAPEARPPRSAGSTPRPRPDPRPVTREPRSPA
jgi:hypothetical protein